MTEQSQPTEDQPEQSLPEQGQPEQGQPEQGQPGQGPDSGAGADPETVKLAHQLFDMARQGQAEQLAAYLDAGAPIDLTDPTGNTLVMLAAYHGHADLVRDLGRRGADVNRLNDRGQSPLAGAVFKGEPAVVAALLEHGADPDAGEPTARATAQMFGTQDLLRG